MHYLARTKLIPGLPYFRCTETADGSFFAMQRRQSNGVILWWSNDRNYVSAGNEPSYIFKKPNVAPARAEYVRRESYQT
jgi:hypothetical protein